MTATIGTLGRLKEEVGDFLAWQRSGWDVAQTATIVSMIESGYHGFLFPEPTEPGRPAHKWSFMYPMATMTTTAPYSTGTVTVVADGGGSIVTLAGAGAAWPTWAADGELTVSGVTYTVKSRTNATQILLDDVAVTVAAGTSFSLDRAAYDLPSDFGGFMGPLTYRPGTDLGYPPIQITSEALIRRGWQPIRTLFRPTKAALRAKAFVAGTGQRYEIVFDPIPDAAYELRYRYKVLPTLPTNDADYLLGGLPHFETILESCLAIAEQRRNDNGSREHTAKFQRRLLASIDIDRDLNAPDTLGYMGNRSIDDEDFFADYPNPHPTATFEGVRYE